MGALPSLYALKQELKAQRERAAQVIGVPSQTLVDEYDRFLRGSRAHQNANRTRAAEIDIELDWLKRRLERHRRELAAAAIRTTRPDECARCGGTGMRDAISDDLCAPCDGTGLSEDGMLKSGNYYVDANQIVRPKMIAKL